MDDRYSSEFQAIKLTDCEPALRSALQELQRTNSRLPLEIFNYKEYIVAGFPLQVSLPSRGPVDGIDIRPVELVLVFFHKAEYPGRAPQIRGSAFVSTERLPHLNPVWPGEPPWLCLHRGSVMIGIQSIQLGIWLNVRGVGWKTQPEVSLSKTVIALSPPGLRRNTGWVLQFSINGCSKITLLNNGGYIRPVEWRM
jgi:hypothetical protein